jgi:hypothetical protein
MRARLFEYSIGATFCLATLVAAISSCGRLDNASEDPVESDTSSVEQAATLAVSAGQTAKLVPGAKFDSQQLAAIFGGATPNGAGDACSVIGTTCAPPINAIVRECGNFSGVCDSTGTMDIIPINFFCLPSPSGPVCSAVVAGSQQTVGCTVPTNGRACSTGCGGSFCAPYPTECAERTNLIRSCLSGGTCSNDTCTNQTFSQEIVTVNGCTRETDGQSCTVIGPNSCDPPRAPLCTTNAVCACLLGPQ